MANTDKIYHVSKEDLEKLTDGVDAGTLNGKTSDQIIAAAGTNFFQTATAISTTIGGSTASVNPIAQTGRTVAVGNFVISTHANSSGYYGRVTAVAGQTSVTVTTIGAFNSATLGGKTASDFAAASHGTHVPTPETADNAKFLRNDNSFQKVTPANIGAAPIDSPTFTGSPKVPSKTTAATNSGTLIATEAQVYAVANSVTTVSIANNLSTSTTGSALDATQGKKLQDEKAPLASPTFTGSPAVNYGTTGNYATACLRNAVISASNPSGGANGDVWFQYI